MATGQASFGDAGDLRSWARLPDRTLQAFVGMSGSNPLFQQFATTASRDAMYAMRNTLAGAIAGGQDWRTTARLMQSRVAGITLTRAQTITRTEVARARRAAALASFQANSHVKSWVWRAALDRSCPACIALHGKEFATDQMQAGHPNCRCVMIPMRARGTNVNIGTGGDYLARELGKGGLPRIHEILGKGRGDWWMTEQSKLQFGTGMPLRLASQQALDRMATFYPNPQWGGMYRPTSLRNLRGGPPPTPPPTPTPTGPVGGFSATPDYSTTNKASLWMNAESRSDTITSGAKQWDDVSAGGVKAASQAKVYESIRRDPALREWATRGGRTGDQIDDYLQVRIREMVDQWAGTSGDTNVNAVAIQLAAQKEFNLTTAMVRHFGKDVVSSGGYWGVNGWTPVSSVDDFLRDAQKVLQQDEVFYRAVLRAQYEITQQAFRDAGITHITLFRSAGTSQDAGTVWSRLGGRTALANMELQPLSSFTSRPSVTGIFGNVFYQTTVPVEYIHSTARTGLGCLNEWEFVVMDADLAPATLMQLYRLRTTNFAFFDWSPYKAFTDTGLPEATDPL
jgi:SPP1 gp7 family putative phage head morphogenesis protein